MFCPDRWFVLAAGLCATQAPESRNPDPPPVDVAGFTTFIAGLAFLSLGFVRLSTGGRPTPAFAVAAALLTTLTGGPDGDVAVRGGFRG
ncbi:hypothetical protein GCM10029964_074920 [Kibdelosporangium lantanae]